uniref:Aminotransferase-like plant mobile domain-containing protein n=1 Tax=Fagus sylvatica TaxID=28930 RepID=A0A2N9HEP2_FAGSY
MSCKTTKTDTGAGSLRPRKRQVLVMQPLCDPWYSATSPLPKRLLPGASSSAKLLCGPNTCNLTVAWFPPPSGLMELRIRRWELLVVPIYFMSSCGHSQSWNDWVDKELQDDEFISCLHRANIYSAVLLSRGSNMYRDIQEETRWEDALYLGFGGREASPGGQKARLNYWIQHFQNHPTCWVRRSAFVIYWLSRYAFDETPSYSIKPFLFELGIKLAQGMSYPLGALCLGNLYIHLDKLHDDEVEGSPYHAVESSVNVTLLQVFFMEHLRTFVGHAKTSKVVQDRVLRSLGDGKGFLSKFSGGFPILFKWVGVKASEVSWMDDLDDEVKFVWQPYVKVKEGFACPDIFPTAPFRDGYSSCFFKDGNLKFCTFLAAITPAWLPTFGKNDMETIHYNPHKVRRQFGLDQDVPSANVVVFDCDTVMAPFIIIQASKYWSDLSVRVTIPADMRVGNLTSHMYRYWDRLNEAFAKYVKSGYDTVSIPEMPKIPLTNPRLKPYSLSLTTYSQKEGCGFAEWDAGCHSWIMHGKAMSSRCQEAESALLATPLKQASSPIVIDEGPSDPVSEALLSPSTSEGRVNIPEVIEKDDSSNTSDIPGHDDTFYSGGTFDYGSSSHCRYPRKCLLTFKKMILTCYLKLIPWIPPVCSLPILTLRANVFTTAIIEKVTDNTHSSEVDLAIQRCGETPHGVSSPLVVGVAALGNTHPCHLNFGSAHSLAMNIVEQDAPVSIVEKNDFDLIQGDFGSFLTVPLLEKLLLKHGNFMSGFKLGMGFGKLFEWMDAVRDLMTTGVAVGFLLDHIRNLGEMWFAQKEKKKQLTSLSSKIAKMEEELLALKSESGISLCRYSCYACS